MDVLFLVVGGVWGALTLLALLNNLSLRTKLNNATNLTLESMEKVKKAEANLEEARLVFQQQLQRPAAAFFSEEQVVSLSNRLVQLLFVPAAQAVKRELSEQKQ
jgi:hypothetical protein